MQLADEGWRFVALGAEGDPTTIGDMNLWDVEWVRANRRITVAHPDYPSQLHTLEVYEVAGVTPPLRFAAGEFSNGVWGFFVPT